MALNITFHCFVFVLDNISCHLLTQIIEYHTNECYWSLLLVIIYEQYLLSKLDNGKFPLSYRSASSFIILLH